MSCSRKAFTLIELLVVVGILVVLISLLLPLLNRAKQQAMRSSMQTYDNTEAARTVASNQRALNIAQVGSDAGTSAKPRTLAWIKSFDATISLTPSLSIGTAQPESIYTAQLSAKFVAANPTKAVECEFLLPLPPQIISLADLAITVNKEPSESVSIRDDKLVWTGILPVDPTQITVDYTAVGKGLYNVQMPPSGILETFHVDLTAVGSDVRMLELSLQPTKHERSEGKTVYTWDYKRLLYGRPISLDVLGIAPIDRLGELTWLGPGSVLVFGLMLGLVSRAFSAANFDRWMLLLVLGAFTGAYPLMYFAQEFIALNQAIALASGAAILIIAVRSITMVGPRIGLFGVTIPATVIMATTLAAALNPRLQGILITGIVMTLFIVAMILLPRLQQAIASPPKPQSVQELSKPTDAIEPD